MVGYLFILFTTLLLPIICFDLSKKIILKHIPKPLYIVIGILILHFLSFFFGYSIRGDFADYILYFLEYLTFCVFVSLLTKINTNKPGKILRSIGKSLIIIIGILSLLAAPMLILISDVSKIVNRRTFYHGYEKYETRHYDFFLLIYPHKD